jgi:hypothetical protein
VRRFLYDTLVFVYAVGRPHPYRDPCRRIVELASEGSLRGEASVELVQEFLHVRYRRTGDRAAAVRESRWVAAIGTLHPVTIDDMRSALTLFETVDGLSARDAVHAATALNRGIDAIVTADTAFDGVRSLQRIDPADAARLLA